MAYRVVMTPVVKRQLDQYVGYTASILKTERLQKGFWKMQNKLRKD